MAWLLLTAAVHLLSCSGPECGPGAMLVDGECRVAPADAGALIRCGEGTLQLDDVCFVRPSDGGVACGPGTMANAGLCLPTSLDAGGTACGPGTVLVDSTCLPAPADGGVRCGPGTTSEQGLCVPLQSDAGVITCGAGTHLAALQCLPDAVDGGLSCGVGTVQLGAECVRIETDAGPPADAGVVTCGPGTVLVSSQCLAAPSDGGVLSCGSGTVRSGATCVVPAPVGCHVTRTMVRPLRPFTGSTGGSNACGVTALSDRVLGWLQTGSTIEAVVGFSDGGVRAPVTVAGVSSCPLQTTTSGALSAGAFALPDAGTLVVMLDAVGSEVARQSVPVNSTSLGSSITTTRLIPFRGAFALGQAAALTPIAPTGVGAPLVVSAHPDATRVTSNPSRGQLHVERYLDDGGVEVELRDEQSLALTRLESLRDFQFAKVELQPTPDLLGVGQWATSGVPYLRSIPVDTTGVLPPILGVGVPVGLPHRMVFTGRFWMFGCCGLSFTVIDAEGRTQTAAREVEALPSADPDAGIAKCSSVFSLVTGNVSHADVLASCDNGQLGTALRSGVVWERFSCD